MIKLEDNPYVYTEDELPQKSDSWLEFRRSGIGASEVPKIMGQLPPQWGGAFDVFLNKMGKPGNPPNKAMERGIIYEDKARNYITNYLESKRLGKNSIHEIGTIDLSENIVEKKVKFQQLTVKYKDFNRIFASFDGIDFNNKLILEIKCPKYENFVKFLKKPKLSKTYLTQVQTQLMIANSHWGITKGIFANYCPEGVIYTEKGETKAKNIRLVLLYVDLDEDITKNIEKTCKNFWSMVETNQYDKNWNEELL